MPPSSPLCPQILLPLINQYFTNHCLYFLSTPAKVLGSGGHASNKEKEMITRLVACDLRPPWGVTLDLSLLHLVLGGKRQSAFFWVLGVGCSTYLVRKPESRCPKWDCPSLSISLPWALCFPSPGPTCCPAPLTPCTPPSCPFLLL